MQDMTSSNLTGLRKPNIHRSRNWLVGGEGREEEEADESSVDDAGRVAESVALRGMADSEVLFFKAVEGVDTIQRPFPKAL
jgi:hypothetical protein